MAVPCMTKVREVLEVEKLNSQQEKAISSLLKGKDVFLSLRTGINQFKFGLIYSFRGESTEHVQAFREWFSLTGEIRSLISCPALVITATDSKEARKVNKKRLALNNCVDIIDSPDRENIKLFVHKLKNTVPIEVTFGWLLKDLSLKKKDCTRTLIFCSSIKICADVYTAFLMVLDKSVMEYVHMFHSCTSENVKEKIREDMSDENGNIRVLIATSAAGMSVNYRGINNAVHYSPPKDMDSFVQQLGRAGRDGSQSFHLLIYNSRHTRKLELDMKNYIENVDKCRRLQMLESYDSFPNAKVVKHLCCDICLRNCECNDKCCLLYQHPYNLFQSDDDSSDDNSCISNETDLRVMMFLIMKWIQSLNKIFTTLLVSVCYEV
ncbi:ATP-dependent helicase wrn-1-like [Saccostrea echinata]|uniref:ATP-dependent helicase wrn-1-like n=1 Tax=Saccostrea echinata TaxID=191078 RepID=UPI002A81D092|nr:ATP-dependent helicase wrn-1-like [Saccostrea echinata]